MGLSQLDPTVGGLLKNLGYANAAASVEGGRLPNLHGWQMAPRPCRQEVLVSESRVRLLLWQHRWRSRLLDA